MAKKQTLTLLALAIVILTLTSIDCPGVALNTASYWIEVYHLYEKLVELHRQGIEVSNAIMVLAEAIELLETCKTDQCLARVNQLLNTTAKLLEKAEKTLPTVQIIRTVSLTTRAIVLLSLPIVAYILLPRIIAWEWYFTRRRWLVTKRQEKCKKR